MKTVDHLLLPSLKFRKKATWFSLAMLVVAMISVYLEFDPLLFFTDFHYMVELLGDMLPPNFSVLWNNDTMLYSVVQTLAMAFLGTLTGGTMAIFFAFLAASNTTPSPFLRGLVRGFLSIERVIPSLVIILVFVISVGLGPFAGMLTLAVGSVGTFGKLFADAIENAEHAPAEAIHAVGATKAQVILYGIIPQVLPSFIANFLYAFDINLRAAIGLGIFGGGE
jgi:phosphonate transport system permease protein